MTAIWQQLAQQIIANCALMIATLTGQLEKEVQQTLLSIVNVARLARQMQFFMTEEYILYFQKNKIPDEIYGKKVAVDIRIEAFRKGTFNDEFGCSIDGKHPDLGPVNGQEPIKEAKKYFIGWII